MHSLLSMAEVTDELAKAIKLDREIDKASCENMVRHDLNNEITDRIDLLKDAASFSDAESVSDLVTQLLIYVSDVGFYIDDFAAEKPCPSQRADARRLERLKDSLIRGCMRLSPDHPLLQIDYFATVDGHKALEERCAELSAA